MCANRADFLVKGKTMEELKLAVDLVLKIHTDQVILGYTSHSKTGMVFGNLKHGARMGYTNIVEEINTDYIMNLLQLYLQSDVVKSRYKELRRDSGLTVFVDREPFTVHDGWCLFIPQNDARTYYETRFLKHGVFGVKPTLVHLDKVPKNYF